MGSRAVFDAIRTLPNTKAPPQIKQLILAAPDIDAATFEQLSETMAKRVGRATLYANSNDEALKASHEIHGYPRAGESGMALVVTRGVDTIDASEVDTGLIGHSYFADRRSVISDIYDLIRFGIGPDKRFGLTASDFHGPHWIFNP
jgi:esterase/lipase superfamily enzyme